MRSGLPAGKKAPSSAGHLPPQPAGRRGRPPLGAGQAGGAIGAATGVSQRKAAAKAEARLRNPLLLGVEGPDQSLGGGGSAACMSPATETRPAAAGGPLPSSLQGGKKKRRRSKSAVGGGAGALHSCSRGMPIADVLLRMKVRLLQSA